MIQRRHMLKITAAAGGVGLFGLNSYAKTPKVHLAKWHGIALGGTASMRVVHRDPEIANNMIKRAVSELRRLEKIFSLYDLNSSVVQLNRDGSLKMPPIELVMLLQSARQISKATDGLFDVSVQPLWDYYSKRSKQNQKPAPLLGQENILLNRQLITLKEGQKITLNGIAQGAITDHLMALFKKHGFNDILLGTGEISASGHNEKQRPWRVALGDKDGPKIDLQNAAVATSEAVPLKPNSTLSHFFNPHTGLCENHFNRVSVIAPNATYADGLSTALMLSEEEYWPFILDQFKSMPLTVHFERKDRSLGTSSNI